MKIRLTRDCNLGPAGSILDLAEATAGPALESGVAEPLENEDREKIAKFYRDKHVLETAGKDVPKWQATTSTDKIWATDKGLGIGLGVDPENYDKIVGKPKLKRKANPLTVFTDKISMAEQFLEKQPLYYDPAGLFWLWHNGNNCWVMKDEVDVMNYIYLSLGANTVNSKERGEIVQALKQVGRLYRPVNIPETWVQFKNGIVDVKNPTVIVPATSEYFATNPIPWNIGQSDETPVMDRIFTEWVGEKYVPTLYEIIAYCLIPSYPIQRLFCLLGDGRNGKSKFLELVRKFVGEPNVCTNCRRAG